MPEVSVIIPTFNRASFLKRAIDSILSQSYQDFEVIVVDDASTDNTEEIVKSIKDERITYLKHERNSGRAVSRNTGVNMARGEYIAFLDSDDEAHPDRLEKQINILQRETQKTGIVYTDMIRIYRNGSRKYIKAPDIMPADGNIYMKALGYKVFRIGTGTSMIRKKCFEKTGGFNKDISYYEDLEFFIRLSKDFYFYHIREPLIDYYDIDGESESNIDERVSSCKMILEEYFDDICENRGILSIHYRKIAFLLLNNNINSSRQYLLKAIKANPLNILCFPALLMTFLGQRFCTGSMKIMNKI